MAQKFPFPDTVRFTNVQAMTPSGYEGSYVYCGSVSYMDRQFEHHFMVHFVAVGNTLTLAPEGGTFEKSFDMFCVNAKLVTAVAF
jgi:hypothetical protein